MDGLVKAAFVLEVLIFLEIIVSIMVSFSVHNWRTCHPGKKRQFIRCLQIMTKIDVIAFLIFGFIMGVTNYRIMVLRNADMNFFVSTTISDDIWVVLMPCVLLIYSKKMIQRKIADSIAGH